MRIVIATLALALVATTAAAGVPDGLQCYELGNANLRGLRGVVDLDAPATGVAPGCKISRAKLYCVGAAAEVRKDTLTDGGKPVFELPYEGRPADTDRVCYRVKCPHPVGSASDRIVTDRFGTHGFRRLRTDMLCVPATGGTLPPPRAGFQIKFPETEIPPRGDITYCYYFRTPNAETLPVARFTSEMSPYAQQLVAFTTTNGGTQQYPVERLPPGLVSAADCGPLPTGGLAPNWMYAANEPSHELAFPTDDGTGKPLALEIPPLSSGFLMLHTVNPTDEPITTSATLNVEPVATSSYTRTNTYVTYSKNFAIPPLTDGHVETKSCPTPPGAQFWGLTTLTHERAIQTQISDGADVVLDGFDWAHPATETLTTPPFRTFASGKLTYACRWNNRENRTIRRGDSYQSDEECLAVGYYFPATRPLQCYEGVGPF
jgi:hypothetical protein